MAIDPEFQKKLQVFLAIAIVLAGGRAAYIVYERHEAMKEDAKPKQEMTLKADYYVTPKTVHAYDLKSARQFTEQPVWVKYGYQLTYYPYDSKRRKTDFGHEAGVLLPLQKLAIQGVVTDVAPRLRGTSRYWHPFRWTARRTRFRLERRRVATSSFAPTTFSSSKIRTIFISIGRRMSGRRLTL